MGLTHIRTPKNFILEERLARYGMAIEEQPEHLRGRWLEACSSWLGASKNEATAQAKHEQTENTPQSHVFDTVRLDLGCGKGAYLVSRAATEPSTLWLGMDVEPICVAYAAQHIVETNLTNAILLPRGAETITGLFAPGELTSITMNFPTPFPRKRDAHRRIINVDHLLMYRQALAEGGTIVFRTDSEPLYRFAITQVEAAGFSFLWTSTDVRAEHGSYPITEYEERLTERGATVFGYCAVMVGTSTDKPKLSDVILARAVEQSLMQYLPDDLEQLSYVPLGMEAAVFNARNRKRNAAERAARHTNPGS